MVAGLGIALGAALVVQIPLLGILPIRGVAFATALAVSTLLLLTLTAICGLYPSWLATRIQPAEALHYE